ncbi:siderophore-iron reductase FhuF [Gulbenkiania mobilis]|uniref:siderophore-iron reductase FhuF n=1 Tax=Gulbenkiania mobilis TaxID=397457 RepID=UPI0006BBF040|nr:siderophore-iron reductase FhuF [Gulbenkiania mobilis]
MSTLHDCLQGALAPYRESVVAGHTPEALPLAALISGARLAEALAGTAARYPGAPARAQVSQWIKAVFRLLIPPVLAGAVLERLALPLEPARIGLRPGPDGLPVVLELDHLGVPLEAGQPVAAACTPLTEQVLAPLIATVATHGRISPRVLWNSAGNLMEFVLAHLTAAGHAEAAACQAVLLEPKKRPDGSANLLWQPVRYVPSFLPPIPSPVRLRRLCCLRYELPGEVCCATCPLLPNKPESELYALLEHWHAQP